MSSSLSASADDCVCQKHGVEREGPRKGWTLVHLSHDRPSALNASSGQEWPSLGVEEKAKFLECYVSC